MKKTIMLIGTMILLFLAVPVFAQEADPGKVSTYLDFRNDFVSSEKTGGQTIQSAVLWWQYKVLGGVLEPEFRSKNHYERIKSSLLWEASKSWYILGGITTDSQGADFVQAGIWYVGNLWKFKVLLDARNYFSISGQNNGYNENKLNIAYPATNKFFVGADFMIDHWWKDGHNLYFVGPKIIYQITERISLYARVSYEWNVAKTGTDETVRLRTGATFAF